MRRRTFLCIGGVSVMSFVAGCTGSDDEPSQANIDQQQDSNVVDGDYFTKLGWLNNDPDFFAEVSEDVNRINVIGDSGELLAGANVPTGSQRVRLFDAESLTATLRFVAVDAEDEILEEVEREYAPDLTFTEFTRKTAPALYGEEANTLRDSDRVIAEVINDGNAPISIGGLYPVSGTPESEENAQQVSDIEAASDQYSTSNRDNLVMMGETIEIEFTLGAKFRADWDQDKEAYYEFNTHSPAQEGNEINMDDVCSQTSTMELVYFDSQGLKYNEEFDIEYAEGYVPEWIDNSLWVDIRHHHGTCKSITITQR
jgi:hypothetical protein